MIPVELEIDELVLHGLDPARAEAFVAALRAELAAGLLPEPVRAALLARGDVELPGPSRPIVLSGPTEPIALGRSAGRAVTEEVIR
jgi:hypothetical protein